jgi:hypothetical protein
MFIYIHGDITLSPSFIVVVHSLIKLKCNCNILVAFGKAQKVTVHFVIPVHLTAWHNLAAAGQSFVKAICEEGRALPKCIRRIQVC